jgi:hypothetical protein
MAFAAISVRPSTCRAAPPRPSPPWHRPRPFRRRVAGVAERVHRAAGGDGGAAARAAAALRETACARGAPDDARWLRALKQAQLPVRLGGLGLTSPPMQRFFPALAVIDRATASPRAAAAAALASPRSPPSTPRTRAFTAQRDEVDAAFQATDASTAAIPAPRPGRRIPLDLAYHPKGLPPAAAALPSLNQMATPSARPTSRPAQFRTGHLRHVATIRDK